MLKNLDQPTSDEIPEYLKLLLSKPSENKERIINYLTTKDEDESSFIFNAVINGENSKVKAILSSLKGYPEILKEVLMQKNIFGYSVLMQAISSQNPEIADNILSTLQGNQAILQEVLMQEDNYGRTVFNLAIFKGNLQIAEKILSFDHPAILREVLMQEDKYGNSILMQAISSQNPQILNSILSSLKDHPEILQEVLMQKNIFGYSVLMQAISSQNPEIVNDILFSLKYYPAILLKVLTQVDKNNYSPLHNAIIFDYNVIAEKILSSLKTRPLILRGVLMQKNNHGYSVLTQAISSQNPEIVNNILSSLKDHPRILQEVLMQKDCNGRSLLNYAIFAGDLQIVEKILSVVDEQTRDIIFNKLDSNGDKVLFMAMKMVIANDDPENTNPKEILKLLVKNKFNIDLDQSQISALTSFYKNHVLLGLMSQDEYGIGESQNPHLFTKILNEVVASSESQDLKANPIAQIYAKEIVKVNGDQPILAPDNQALYLYRSNLFAHSSYVIFNVDQATNILKSISYCDGHFYLGLRDQRPHRDSLLPATVYGVREFELENEVKFSEEFARRFIRENFQGRKVNSLQLPFMVDSHKIAIKGTTRAVETREQRRGNCSFKSANILARYLLQKQTGKDYSKDYQEFKKHLRSQVVKGLVQDYEKVKEQLGEEFVEHLGIEKRLKEVAKEKFGIKEPELFENAISSVEAMSLNPSSRSL